jgi:DNA-directed RNA polymerase subunit M/transcription elongation factor TFIIS
MHTILKTVATFEYAHFAHLAKAKLQSEDIECFLFDENTSSMIWFYTNAIGGIKLKVRAEDFDRAERILKENADGIGDDYDIIQDKTVLEDRDEIITCPKCGAGSVKYEKYSKRFAYLSIILLGFPLLFRNRRYECLNCGNKWDK